MSEQAEMTMPDYLTLMEGMSKSMPNEGDWVATITALVDVMEELHGQIREDQMAVLAGVGAVMYGHGFREHEAEVGMRGLMGRVMKP